MPDTVPIGLPATSTRSPLTIWLAFWKIALTWYGEPLDITIRATATTASTTAASAAARPITLELRTGASCPIDLLPRGAMGLTHQSRGWRR